MELTQEYFDKGIADIMEKMATKEDLAKLKFDLESKMPTKDDLKAQTVELKQYTTQAFETQQVWMEQRFDELIVKYNVRERVGKLEKDVAKLKLNRPAHV
jgi:hypothetical protein